MLSPLRRQAVCALPAFAGAALLMAVSATASSPPKRTLVFDPVQGSIGGVHPGDPMSKLTALIGHPDRIVQLSSQTRVSVWVGSGKPLCSAWAIAAPSARDRSRVSDFSYRGPVKSTRGDRIGTPLSVVRGHWRPGWNYVSRGNVGGSQGPNYGRLNGRGSAAFGFDAHNRLAGVAVRGSSQYWQPIVLAC
jgi:hypothetical protein